MMIDSFDKIMSENANSQGYVSKFLSKNNSSFFYKKIDLQNI